MKQLLVVFTLLVSTTAFAELTPEQVFGGILDLIQAQIDKDKAPQYGPGVLLKDMGEHIALGRLRLTDKNNADSFTLPQCKKSKNVVVSDLRFRVTGENVFVDRIRITYQNGEMESVNVNQGYQKNSFSGWYQVSGVSRCVKSISVRGVPMNDHFGLAPMPGGGHNGGWSGNGFKPPHQGKSEAVLTFIGFKGKNSGF